MGVAKDAQRAASVPFTLDLGAYAQIGGCHKGPSTKQASFPFYPARLECGSCSC